MDGAGWIMKNANWELCVDCARCECSSSDHVCEVNCHDGQFCFYVGGKEAEIEVDMPDEPQGNPTVDPDADINDLPEVEQVQARPETELEFMRRIHDLQRQASEAAVEFAHKIADAHKAYADFLQRRAEQQADEASARERGL